MRDTMQEKILGNWEMAKIGSPQFRIRLDESLKKRLEEEGEAAGRSLNGEIEYRLLEYERQKEQIIAQGKIKVMREMQDDIRKQTESLRKTNERMKEVDFLFFLKRSVSHREEILSELREKGETAMVGYAEYEVILMKKEFSWQRNTFLERYGYDFTEEPQ